MRPPRIYGDVDVPERKLRLGDLRMRAAGVDAWNGRTWVPIAPTGGPPPVCICPRDDAGTLTPDRDCDVHGIQVHVAENRRQALQPIWWCTVPGIVLLALATFAGVSWLAWPGWTLLLAAPAWSGVLSWRARQRANESMARFRESVARTDPYRSH